MTAVELPALDGRTPLGFLAALGVLRLLHDHTDLEPRLAWSPDSCAAVLDCDAEGIDDLAAALRQIVDQIPQEGVIAGLPPGFPPPGPAPDRLRLTRDRMGGYAAGLWADGGAPAERWMGSLVTDIALDDQGRAGISLFAAPSGKQSMRTMLEKTLQLVREDPDLLRQALVVWRRSPDVTGEYLDHRALFDAVDSSTGGAHMRGVPGATWLALMAYPLLRTTGRGQSRASTCWQSRARGPQRLVYPLWSDPMDSAAVVALLDHPVLAGADPGAPPARSRLLSVFWVCAAERRSIPGGKSAGVLAPVPPGRTLPDGRAPRPRGGGGR